MAGWLLGLVKTWLLCVVFLPGKVVDDLDGEVVGFAEGGEAGEA